MLHSNLALGATGDINVANREALGLDPLASSSGTTKYFLPLPGSPLIDRVAVCLFNTDARGATRPADGDGNGSALCDSGAIERQPLERDTVFQNGFEAGMQ